MSTNKTTEQSTEAVLYKCVPVDWMWVPKPVRKIVGWITIVLFALSFFSPLFAMILLIPRVWYSVPVFAVTFFLSLVASFLAPQREWPAFRKIGQLWYEVFDFSANLSPAECAEVLNYCDDHKLVCSMAPHGIVPFQAILWAAYCHQYFADEKTGKSMYGFGAAADAVMYVPYLRNIMAFLTGGSATYTALKNGLVHGKAPAANAAGRIPKNLYILPGGVAEIFTSKPGYNAIVFKSRRGLIKLSIETGAELVPCYVFGGTDFFHTLATSDSYLSKLSRKLRMGITIFWGQFGLPIPFAPKVTMVLGKPIPPPKVTEELDMNKAIDILHQQYMDDVTALFDKYKALAGYPGATLDIL